MLSWNKQGKFLLNKLKPIVGIGMLSNAGLLFVLFIIQAPRAFPLMKRGDEKLDDGHNILRALNLLMNL